MIVDAVFLEQDEGRVRCTWIDRAKRVSEIFDLNEVEQTPSPRLMLASDREG
jgi:hypothetical protein